MAPIEDCVHYPAVSVVSITLCNAGAALTSVAQVLAPSTASLLPVRTRWCHSDEWPTCSVTFLGDHQMRHPALFQALANEGKLMLSFFCEEE